MFRSLVVASATLYVIWYLLPYDSLVGSNMAAVNLMNLDGYGATFNSDHWFFTNGILVLWVVAALGLWRFRNWARYLYLSLTIWSLVAAILYGIRVSSPIEETLGLVLALLDGGILALAFLSPLRRSFD